MTKRIVILQEEQLVIREIQRNMQRAATAAVALAPAQFAMAGTGNPGIGGSVPVAPPLAMPENEPDADEPPDPVDNGNGSLAAVAKAAAMKAERAAIEQTLRQVHWNRRKAAQILGVSYKTLLNKIKECGISRG